MRSLIRYAVFKLVWSAGAALLAAQPAAAQVGGPGMPTSDWRITVGLGAIVVPSYLGSSDSRILPVPLIGAEYKGRVSVGAAGAGGAGFLLGVRVGGVGPVTASVGAGFLGKRDEDRGPRLVGMGDRDMAMTAGASLGLRVTRLATISGSFVQAFAEGSGRSADLGLSVRVPTAGPPFISVHAGATFADADRMGWEFGISPKQAASRSGVVVPPSGGSAYRPDGGLFASRASLSVAQPLGGWTVIGSLGVSRLGDAAAASPLVAQRSGLTVLTGISRTL